MTKASDRKRIFIAIDVAERLREDIGSYIADLRREFEELRVSWERKEKLHLTLKFLGDTEIKQIRAVEKITSEVAARFSPFELAISGVGVFSSPKNARVLWLGVQDISGHLKSLQSMIETRCCEIGFEAEKREFKPHLTIARIREPQKSIRLAEKHLRNGFESEKFLVSEIVVYESQLLPSGSQYFPLSKHKLGQI